MDKHLAVAEMVKAQIIEWRRERAPELEDGDLMERVTKKIRTMAEEARKDWHFTPRVLIVDDNPLSVKLIETCLRLDGCETFAVTNGNDAILEITRNDYDLMVLDWRMPELSGSETLVGAQDIISFDATFRLPWVTNHMPVVLYTGEEFENMDLPHCDNFEYVGHIPKDSTFPRLKQITSEILRSLRAA